MKNGSYVLYNTKAQNLMDLAYNKSINEGYFIPKCISRKKNIVPVIMGVLEV
jgi:inorganic pyrophosphatase/exopolyphosphatase